MSTIESAQSGFEPAASNSAPFPGAKLEGVVIGHQDADGQQRYVGIYKVPVNGGFEEYLVKLPRDFPVETQAVTAPLLDPVQTVESELRQRGNLPTRAIGEGISRAEWIEARREERTTRLVTGLNTFYDLKDRAVEQLGLASDVPRPTVRESAVVNARAVGNVVRGVSEVVRDVAEQAGPVLRQPAVRAVAAVTVLGAGLLPLTQTEAARPKSSQSMEHTAETAQEANVEMPQQKLIHYVYTPSRATHLHAIAADLHMTEQELARLNPQWVGKEIPAGKHINAHGVAGVLETKQPVSVSVVAKRFGLTDDAVDASNHVDEQGLIHEEIRLPGRVIYEVDGVVDINAVAQKIGTDTKAIEFMNASNDGGLVVVPATDFVDQKSHQQILLALSIKDKAEVQVSTTSTSTAADNAEVVTSAAPETSAVTTTLVTTTGIESTTTSLAPETTTTVPGTEAPATTMASEVEKSPEEKAAELMNQALRSIDIMHETNDLTMLVGAVKVADAVYAPHDPDRRSDLPAGYVKALLPNELDGVAQLRVPAERTAGPERYYSAEAEATSRAWAKLMEQLGQKYPQYAHAALRIRDANSPNHRTHQYGQMFDISSNMGLYVSLAADGPFGDISSPNYSFEYSKDLANALARLGVGDTPAIRRIISSDRRLVAAVNSALGVRFMSYDDSGEHRDHWHVIMDPKFNLPSWGLRARDLPWNTEQDLRIGSAAKPITAEQHQLVHGAFEQWVAEKLQAFAAATTTTTTVPAVAQPSPPVVPVATSVAPRVTPTQPEAVNDLAFIESLNVSEQQKAFLRTIVPIGLRIARQYQLNPEVLIAQAAMESGYGSSGLASVTNNLFGIKAGVGWTGETQTARVGNAQSSHVAKFRKYPSITDSIEDYARLISTKPWYEDSRQHADDPRLYALGLVHELNPDGSIAKRQGQRGVQSYDVNPQYVDQVMAVIKTLQLNQIGTK